MKNPKVNLAFSNMIHNKLVTAFNFHNQGCFDKAQIIYEQILELDPLNFDALRLLGSLAAQINEFDLALTLLIKALKLNSNNPYLFNSLGNVYTELGDMKNALNNFNRAVSLKPDFAEAYSNRSKALKELGFLDQALKSCNNAIALSSDYADAYNNLGLIFLKLNLYDESLASFSTAINIRPNYAEAYFHQGLVFVELLKLNEARSCFMKAIEINPLYFNARWAIPFSYVPYFFIEQTNYDLLREQLSLSFDELSDWLTDDKLKDAYKAVGSTQAFYLAYHNFNNKNLLSKYGAICCNLMNYWQLHNNFQSSPLSKSGKIRVGIIGEHIRYHSVWNAITKGFVLNFDLTKFEIHIFHLGSFQDNETRLAKSTASSFTENITHLPSLCKSILSKHIEVLLYPEVGMNPLTCQLASLRLAPIQLATWGHPETTGLPSIDYYLSAEFFEPVHAEQAYAEVLIKLPNLGCYYSNLKVTPKPLDLNSLNINVDFPILLCPGVTFKYTPENDYVFIEIAKQLKLCQFVFFIKDKHSADLLKNRLTNSFLSAGMDVNEYVFFIPWLNSEEFYGLMHQADVYLDTLGFSGFNTAMQAIDCALPLVTIDGEFMRGRLASGILKRMGLTELIANSKQAFIELAVRLASNKTYRQNISEKIIELRAILYEDKEPVLALQNFLTDKCRK